jgi:ParB-like chromosome segregation protein Spo0J
LEEAGIFGYTPGELERLAESVEKDGFLQPILVTSDGNGGFLRIAGKMHVKAAKKLHCSVPCYVRQFPDEKSVISAAKAENFRRRLWDPARVIKEEQAIEKFLSRNTQKRIANVRKLHPSLIELCKKGVLKHRADEGFIENLKSLDMDVQASLAETIKEIVEAKFTSKEQTETLNKVKEATQTYNDLAKKIKKTRNDSKPRLSVLKTALKKKSKSTPTLRSSSPGGSKSRNSRRNSAPKRRS